MTGSPGSPPSKEVPGYSRRTAATVTLITVVGVAGSLLSQIVVSMFYGASPALDAYLVAQVIPATVRTFFAGGALLVLVPRLIEIRAGRGEQAALRHFAEVTMLIMLAMLAMMGAVWALFPTILLFMAPGFSPAQAQLCSKLSTWTCISAVLSAAASLVTALHHFNSRFRLPTLAAYFPVLTVPTAVLLLSPIAGIFALALGDAIGALLWLLCLALSFPKTLSRIRWGCGLRLNTDVATTLGRMIPVASLASCHSFISVLERLFASTLGSGVIAQANYASRMANVASLLMSSGIAIVSYPYTASLLAKSKLKELHAAVEANIETVGLIALPLWIVSLPALPSIIGLLLQHGEFKESDTQAVSMLLAYYLGVAALMGIGQILGRANYLFKHTTGSVLVGVIAVSAYTLACALAVRTLGAQGLGIGAVTYWLVIVLGLALSYLRRVGERSLAVASWIVVGLTASLVAMAGNLVTLRLFELNRVLTIVVTAIWVAIAYGLILRYSRRSNFAVFMQKLRARRKRIGNFES